MKLEKNAKLVMLSWDRVHPNQAVHIVIACAFLKTLDFTW